MTVTMMAREVAEQPGAIADTLDALRPLRRELAALATGRRNVLFVARGSSDNAAVYGRYWAFLDLATDPKKEMRRWLLIRRSTDDPEDLGFYQAYGPEGTQIEELVRVCQERWAVEVSFQEMRRRAWDSRRRGSSRSWQ